MDFKTNMYAYIIYVFTILMNEKSAKDVVQAYLSGILVHKGGSIAIFNDN